MPKGVGSGVRDGELPGGQPNGESGLKGSGGERS